MLAVTDYRNPVLWAVIIGWILTVVVHEFAHGLLAYLGGDYTIRERGGLTLNPLQYIHPVTSILMPALFVLMGGIPLPGGATYIRTDLLRSRYWASAVSLAGPVSNFLLFLAFAMPFHPAVHWMIVSRDPSNWTNLQLFMGASAFLQLLSVLLNLLPIPPLDGFGIIAPFLPAEWRARWQSSQISMMGFAVIFLLLITPMAQRLFGMALYGIFDELRFGGMKYFFLESARRVL